LKELFLLRFNIVSGDFQQSFAEASNAKSSFPDHYDSKVMLDDLKKLLQML
jgi:hypothetical protein